TIEGYHDDAFPTRRALLNRGNTAFNSYAFELLGADDVTLDHLQITGGAYGVFAAQSADSDRFAVTASTIFGNFTVGNALATSNDFARIADSMFFGIPGGSSTDNQITSISLDGTDATVSGNKVFDSPTTGIRVTGDRTLVAGNEVYGNSTGIGA